MNFDNAASLWDTDIKIARAKILSDKICQSLPLVKYSKALEFGCGTGLITFGLLDKFDNIICTDNSKEMLKIVDLKVKDLKIKNVSTFESDIFDFPDCKSRFDVIYSSMVLHHIMDIEKILVKLYSLLKPGGYLIIIDLDKEDGHFHMEEKDFKGHNGFERDKLQDVLKDSGFSEILFSTAYEGKKQVNDELIGYSLFLCKANCKKLVNDSL